MSRRKKIIVVFVLIGGIVFWRFWSSKNKPILVDISTVKKGKITQSVSASGKVSANQIATLTFQTSGELAYLGVSEGDKVKRGQIIASLNKRQLEATLRKYLNAFEREFTEFNDSNDLIKDSVLTDSIKRIKSRAQIDLNQTVLDVEIQNEAIRLSNLYSPIQGVVTSINPKHTGIYVNPNSASFEIVNPETVFFEAKVPEADISKIKEGLRAKINLDAYPLETLEEKVLYISFSSTTTSTGATAYLVKISLPANAETKYRLGMSGDAEIILYEKENVLLVPQTSIVNIEGKNYIWAIENGIAKKTQVETGISSFDEIEILNGIKEGTQIVNRPPKDLGDGDKVSEKTTK